MSAPASAAVSAPASAAVANGDGPSSNNSSSSGGGRPPIHAVIYDLDGTLLDTETLSTEAIQAVVGRFGKTFTWEIKKKILGMRGEEWGRIVVDDLGLHGQLEPMTLVLEWEKELAALAPSVQLLPGAKELVAYFHGKGLPQAIATSSSRDLVSHKRRRHEGHVFGRMRTVVTGDDPAVKVGKPAPDIYLAAAARLGVEPRHCLVFEDALNGVQSGKAAGMQVVAVPDPKLDVAPFIEHAHEVLNDLLAFDPRAWGFEEASIHHEGGAEGGLN